MPKDILFATGEAAQKVGVSRQYVKDMAQALGLAREILRVGKRQDWLWTQEQIDAVAEVLHKND